MFTYIGYEPTGHTVHPPKKKPIEGRFIFLHGCLMPSICFFQKVDFVGDIKS